MNMDDYQYSATTTAVFTHDFYPAASLMVESAELADLLVKPMLRGDDKVIDKAEIAKEAGDVLWNLADLLDQHGIALSTVATMNLAKLADRARSFERRWG